MATPDASRQPAPRRLSRTLAALCSGSTQPDARVPADEAAARLSAAVDGAGEWGRWPTLEVGGGFGPQHMYSSPGSRWESEPDGWGGTATLSVIRDAPGEPGTGDADFINGQATAALGFTDGLRGTNALRLRCAPAAAPSWELPAERQEGFALTIGSFEGLIMSGHDPETERAVQVHLDWMQAGGVIDPSRAGLIFYLVRGARPRDSEIYPTDAYGQPSLSHLDDDEKRQLHERMLDEQLEHQVSRTIVSTVSLSAAPCNDLRIDLSGRAPP